MATSLFPTNNGSPPLVQMKAGKCQMVLQPNGKYMVTPENIKGTVLLETGTDNLVHFKWVNRQTKATVDDCIVFPNEASFSSVQTGVEKDRVYLLKWKNSSRKFMFWLQEKSTENDAEKVAKMNEIMNSTPQNENQQWMQAMGLSLPPPAAVPAAAAPSSSAASALGNIDFQSLFAGAAAPVPPTAGATTTTAPPAVPSVQATPPMALQDIITSERIVESGLLNDPAVRSMLLPLLPEGQQTDGALEENVRSPQFRQAIASLSDVLNSDNFNSVMANFNIDPSPGMSHMMAGDAVGAFLACITAEAKAKAAEATASPEGGSADMDVAEGDSEAS